MEFRISRLNAVKDLTGGFGSAWVSGKSEISHDYLENIVATAETELRNLDDNSGTHLDITLAIAVFERKIVKILGIIPIVVKEQLVWRGGKTSKGTLPVRIAA